MATVTKLGPADHGRPMTYDEYLGGDYQEGYQYELIGGKLYVSPQVEYAGFSLGLWLYKKLDLYSSLHPDVINLVAYKSRVFVPGSQLVSAPEPDLAAYHDFPRHSPRNQVRWEETSPILVGEVISADDPDKDLVRNVDLYFQVRSIREYWVVDPRSNADQPTMTVYRRYGKRWLQKELAFGDTYVTKLLPGFKLIVDPNA